MVPPSIEVSETVIEKISDALETPIEYLPPLYEEVDPDGLNAIVTPTGDEASHDVTVSFTYAGFQVFVHTGGSVFVRPLEGGEGEELLPPEWTPSES